MPNKWVYNRTLLISRLLSIALGYDDHFEARLIESEKAIAALPEGMMITYLVLYFSFAAVWWVLLRIVFKVTSDEPDLWNYSVQREFMSRLLSEKERILTIEMLKSIPLAIFLLILSLLLLYSTIKVLMQQPSIDILSRVGGDGLVALPAGIALAALERKLRYRR